MLEEVEDACADGPVDGGERDRDAVPSECHRTEKDVGIGADGDDRVDCLGGHGHARSQLWRGAGTGLSWQRLPKVVTVT